MMSRPALAWASFDWANSAFPTVVSTFVIAAYFTRAVAPDPATGQALWGWMQAAAGLTIALLSLPLGALADHGGHRRSLLAASIILMVGATALIWFTRPDPAYTVWLLLCVGVATVAFELGTVFYNAMLPEVAKPQEMGRLSGCAWGVGYVGGLTCLGLALFGLIQPDPAPFGLDREAAEPVRAVALLVALWVLAFGWPVLVFVPERRRGQSFAAAVGASLAETKALLRGLPARPAVLRFLIARLFYTDGLNTLFAFGAVFAAGVHGMDWQEILLFGIALNITAGAGAAGFGLIEDRLGSRRTALIALTAMVMIGTALLLVEDKGWFWALALALGIFIGPAQAASRTLMARLSPPQETTAHFGLFALSGRITGFVGPAVLAAVTEVTGSQRAGMASILVFLALGAAILAAVPDKERERERSARWGLHRRRRS